MAIPTYDCKENEHQEMFYVGADMARPIAIHIPSPLGRLPYHVFVRTTASAASMLDGVAVKIDVGGLTDENLELPTDANVAGVTLIPSKADGLVWRRMCTAEVSRGNGTLRFLSLPDGVGKADVLLCTWPRYVTSGQADDWLACQSDPLWAPSGVPLGGIGGGRVDICRDGRFRNFSMNNNQDAPLEDPMGMDGARLWIACDGNAVALSSLSDGDRGVAAPTLGYEARFPQAKLIAENVVDGIDVEVTLSGTLTPHDIKTSSIPGFLVRWKVTNRLEAARGIRAGFSWPNLVGVGGGVSKAETKIGKGDGTYRHWSQQSSADSKCLQMDDIKFVRFSAEPSGEYLASTGSHVIAVAGGSNFRADDASGGGVWRDVEVPPGGVVEVDMAMIAAMPHWVDSHHEDRGAHWENFFATDIEMAVHLLSNADAILRGTAGLANHLGDGTLPEWLTRRLSNCCYPLVTNSVLYKDGRFSINEGPTEMNGCYGTIDQRLAAHPATQLIFPSLNKQELSEFAAVQSENGGMNHDLGHGHLENGPNEMAWPDLTCSFVIQTARHSWSTGDKEFEDAMYPRAVNALRRHAEWASSGGGVAQLGAGLGTSYDSYHYFATTGYMATLWIAALNVGEEWAKRRGDTELVGQLAEWREVAINRLDSDLWNGKYYDAYGNGADISRKTCHAGQIAGQRFSAMLTGRNVLPAARLDQVVDALIELNGSDRYVAPPDEVAADGSVASDFSWLPYIEGFMLTAIATRGDERLWPIWERMIAATFADGATPCDTRLMYVPETGEQTWGTYYMTAPASWLVYDAWTGFFHDANLHLLRFRNLAPGRYPIVSPLFWATLEVGEGGKYALRIKRTFETASLALDTVEMHGKDAITSVGLPPRTTIAEGELIEWDTSG